jgi:hypothetical protein
MVDYTKWSLTQDAKLGARKIADPADIILFVEANVASSIEDQIDKVLE